MKKLNLKKLAKTVSAFMAMSCVSTLPMVVLPTQVQASDIEIYKEPQQGQKTIMMMLDTSGSMLYCDTPITLDLWDNDDVKKAITPSVIFVETPHYANLYWNLNNNIPDKTVKEAENRAAYRAYFGKERDNENKYYREFCYAQKDGKPDLTDRQYNRITKLKDAIFALMNNSSINETIVMGIGVFHDNNKGKIIVPARPLTTAHKALIKEKVAQIEAKNGTPSASAYAEAAAYMMGTTTTSVPDLIKPLRKEERVNYMNNNGTYENHWWRCTKWSDTNSAECVSTGGGDNGVRHPYDTNKWGEQACSAGSYSSGWAKNRCLYDKTLPLVDTKVRDGAKYVSQYSGFAYSDSTAKDSSASNYVSPLPTTGKECSGQAIYFLTDGYPNGANESQLLMRSALASKAGDFPEAHSNFADKTKYLESNNDEGMAQAGELAKRLRDKARNPTGSEIFTAVVGFGKDFSSAKDKENVKELQVLDGEGNPKLRKFYDCNKLSIREVRNACNWGEKSHAELPGVGGYGEGGFYYAEESQDIVKSVEDVIAEIPSTIPDIKTGAPSIPVDPLTRQSYINAAYYAEFSPRPETLYQLWKGKMGKYNLLNDTIVGKDNVTLYDTNGDINKNVKALWDSLAELKLQKNQNSTDTTARVVYTNRKMNGNTAENSNELNKVDLSELLGNGGKFSTDPNKNYWLNFLGYLVGITENIQKESDLTKKSELRQLGATMHSTPIMLTQKGKVAETNYSLNISDREDYLLYGSTQGALHVVDEKTGQEKFAFVPNEMMVNQKEAFLDQEQTSGGKNALYYGVDAPWTAHTRYAINNDGVSTVKSPDNNQIAHQWVYGGLRMGGRSYYALDLTDMNTPKMKFHIDPTTGNIYSQGREVKNYAQIKTMGQSWSKPVLGYVNWRVGNKVERKLVMFVGGGYDAGGSDGNGIFTNGVRTAYDGYEKSNYEQTNKRGAGVFMFDADTGSLLWWASANDNRYDTNGVKYLSMPDMKYSVVSRINTVDRNNDGLIDNLYFGDLGGQGFRIDLNNNATSNDSFAVRGVRLFNEHKADGTSPRFYDMPSVAVFLQTAAQSGNNRRFVTASFVSGDMSSPLAGTEKDVLNKVTVKPTAQDGVFVVYDNDIGRHDLYESSFTSGFATNGSLIENDLAQGVPQLNATGQYNRGWKYIYPANATTAGMKKGTGEPYTFINFLFANIYNKDGQNNTGGSCGAGVRGNTTLEQFCMPTGKCLVDIHGFANNSNAPSSSVIGAGNVRSTLSNSGEGVVVNASGKDKGDGGKGKYCETHPQDPLCQEGIPSPGVQQLRWYETH